MSLGGRVRLPISRLRLLPVLASGLATALSCAAPPDGDADVTLRSTAVIGGTPTAPGQYPATGALLFGATTSAVRPLCTGTLVGPQAVLTAGHCVVLGGDTLPQFTLAGAVASGDAPDGGAPLPLFQVVAARVHPDFRIDNPSSASLHDIALVFLDRPAIESSAAEVMAGPGDGAALAVGVGIDIVGYGRTGSVAADVAHIKSDGIAAVVEVGPDEMTVGAPSQVQDCTGDSGGPGFLPVPGPDARRLVGVVSRGRSATDQECVAGAIQTRVDVHRAWIDAALADWRSGGGGTGGPGGAQAVSGPCPDGAGCRMAPSGDGGAWLWSLLMAALAGANARTTGRRSD